VARNTEKTTMVVKHLTPLVDVVVLVSIAEKTDCIKIKKDYKKCLTDKRKYDIINT
jgi:hypothetical protein